MVEEVNYKQAAAYIEELPKFTKKHTLAYTKEFLRRLGNPAEDRKIIHVAGTNGKGSVCAYIQTILMSEGKKTGFFTSPHLVSMNERIRLNQESVAEDEFLSAFEFVLGTVEKMECDGMMHPSYFEFLFGMGMVVFGRADVEYVILETGLGGRLDATNAVMHPTLTVITSISLDHTEILGDTVEKIAFEKAGIIKSGVMLLFDGTDQQAASIIREIAEERGAPCREISKNAFEIQEVTPKSIAFSRMSAYDKSVTWVLPVCGIYQAMNAELAIEAGEYLLKNTSMHRERWKDALASMRWEGRMEEVAPHMIVDGAHNPGAIKAFADSLNAACPKGSSQPVILFAVAADKDYDAMVSILCGNIDAKVYIVTEIEDKRRVSAEELARVFGKYTNAEVICCRKLEEAFVRAREKRGQSDVYCLGSLYLAGMVKKLLAGGDCSA